MVVLRYTFASLNIISGTHLSNTVFRPLLLILTIYLSVSITRADVDGAMQKLFFAPVSSTTSQTPDNVTAIVQDKRGFIWIATSDGLLRFDGREFKKFKQDPRNPSSLPDNIITSILLVENNTLLISTLKGGIFWFDTISEKITPVEVNNFDLSTLRIQSLHYEASQNRIWIGSFNGLYQLNTKTKTLTHFSHNPLDELTIPGRLVHTLMKDRADQLWIGTDSGLARYNPKTDDFKHLPLTDKPHSNLSITTLYLDSDGSIWVGTERLGLFHITNAGSRIQAISLSNSKLFIRNILRLSSGDLWVATNAGVYVIPSFGEKPIHHSTTPGDSFSIGDNDTLSLFEDSGKLVWIGTSKTIYNAAPETSNFGRLLNLPFSALGLSHNYVSSIIENSSGDILIATQRGMDVFDIQNNLIKRFPTPLAQFPLNPQLHKLFLDEKNRLWIGDSQGHVAVLNNNYQVLFSVSLSENLTIKNNPILFIYEQKNGSIWIGSEHRIIHLNGNDFTAISEFNIGGPDILERTNSQTLVEDNSGNLWFATTGMGLLKYQPDNNSSVVFKHLSADINSISHDTINDLLIDESGDLWIATSNGLNRIKQIHISDEHPKFEKWLETDGLLDADIRGLSIDASGWLWMSTASGISRLKIDGQKIENYTSKYGLQNSEFNPDAILKSTSGNLFFGGNNGVVQIFPDNFKKNLHPPEVVITDISIRQGNWKAVSKASQQLAHDENDIRFKVSALNFYQPNLNHFRYRLKGFNNEWVDNQTNSVISFTNLPGGNFTLEVEAANNDDFWSHQPGIFSFKIFSPWWTSLWAYFGYTLLIITAMVLFLTSHRKKLRNERKISQHLRRNDRLKDEFLAVISHELRTPLTGIIGITESMMEGSSGPQNKRSLEGLSLISQSGKRLASLVNEILDFKKLTHDSLQLHRRAIDLSSLLTVVCSSCQILIGNKPVNLHLNIEADLPSVIADSNRLQQIIYNLVGNAIKFTDKGRVNISAKLLNNVIEIAIEDTGIGIAKTHLEKIFKPFEQIEPVATRKYGGSGLGLSITSKLVKLHDSQLSVTSTPGVGSRFWFSLQLSESDQFVETVPALSEALSISTSSPNIIDTNIQSNLVSQEAAGSTKKSILVADDEVVNRKVICDFLQLAGYQTIEANNGEEALQLATTQLFDLVILDVMMPQLSGFDVCKELRRQHTAIELPILLISATRDSSSLITGLESGANDYISKPVERNVLLARVKTLLLLRKVSQAQKSKQQELALEQTIQRLTRYFPKPMIDKLLQPEQAKGFEASRRLITVVFADLVGFTELTDRFEAEIITDLLNQFISQMNQLVETHNGVLNEVLGDGLVILFGAPVELSKKQQTIEAINLSLEMQATMKNLGQQWLKQGLDHNVQLRIGIHQDFATVGNIGSDNLIAYRAVGSGVNLACRLQTECQPGMILLSYPVYAQTREMFNYDELQEKQFKGFTHAHRVCNLDPSKN